MRQIILTETAWRGGVYLNDEDFAGIVQPSFKRIAVSDPARLYLPMTGRDGRSCRVTVSAGEYVEPYGIVGVRDDGSLQDYHVVRTDLPGYVTKIQRELIGYHRYAEYVTLEVCRWEHEQETPDFSERWQCRYGQEDDEQTARALLMDSGIPSVNGILFDGERERRCELIIMNAVTDDPSLFYDRLMLGERSGQILYGLLIFLRLLEAQEVWIAVSGRQRQAAEAVVMAADRLLPQDVRARFSLIVVSDRYPGGREELLLRDLAAMIGDRSRVVVYMDQVLGSYDMLYDHRPWTRRRLLIGGCMSVNGYYELPVGTRLMELRQADSCRRDSAWMPHAGLWAEGGLMAGHSINPETAVVHGDMQSLLMLPRMEESESACAGCLRCENVCPAGLAPWRTGGAQLTGSCMGCGSCSYVCPSRRRLAEFMQRGGRQALCTGDHYIELPPELEMLPPAVVTGYSSPYIRQVSSPFACILSPFNL